MKWFDRFEVRMVLLTCLAGIVLASLYLAWEPYLGSHLGYRLQPGSAGHDGQRNLLRNSAGNPQNKGMSCECALACSLPDGWQANWGGGKLWITHYNPNGTVADALPFKGPEDFYQWFETHPDCCDVNVAKFAASSIEDVVPATATVTDTSVRP